jgi:predicted nucleotidyltransferase
MTDIVAVSAQGVKKQVEDALKRIAEVWDDRHEQVTAAELRDLADALDSVAEGIYTYLQEYEEEDE